MVFVPLTKAVAAAGPDIKSSSAPLLSTLKSSVAPAIVKAWPEKPVCWFKANVPIFALLDRSSVPAARFKVAPVVPAPPLPIDCVWPLISCGAKVAPLLTVTAVLLSDPEPARASVPEVTVVAPVYVFAPLRVNLPLPATRKLPFCRLPPKFEERLSVLPTVNVFEPIFTTPLPPKPLTVWLAQKSTRAPVRTLTVAVVPMEVALFETSVPL